MFFMHLVNEIFFHLQLAEPLDLLRKLTWAYEIRDVSELKDSQFEKGEPFNLERELYQNIRQDSGLVEMLRIC